MDVWIDPDDSTLHHWSDLEQVLVRHLNELDSGDVLLFVSDDVKHLEAEAGHQQDFLLRRVEAPRSRQLDFGDWLILEAGEDLEDSAWILIRVVLSASGSGELPALRGAGEARPVVDTVLLVVSSHVSQHASVERFIDVSVHELLPVLVQRLSHGSDVVLNVSVVTTSHGIAELSVNGLSGVGLDEHLESFRRLEVEVVVLLQLEEQVSDVVKVLMRAAMMLQFFQDEVSADLGALLDREDCEHVIEALLLVISHETSVRVLG